LAVVYASQNVSVVVRNQRYDEITIYNGIRSSGGSPGWEQVGSTLYVPVLKRNWYGRHSKIDLVNTGGASANVYAYFYVHDTGSYRGYLKISDLSPNERYRIESDAECSWGSGTQACCPSSSYCSVRLVSTGGALAAVVREQASDGSAPTTYNASNAGSTSGYAPLVKKNYNLQSTGISVMNTSTSNANVTVTYYNANGSGSYTAPTVYNLPSHAVTVFHNPAGLTYTLSSAVIQTTQPAAALVHESGSGLYKATNAYLLGGASLFAPELNTTTGYGSGISVQNAGSSNANVTVHYYYSNGTSAGTPQGPYSIGVGKAWILSSYNGLIPSGLSGSAWIESTNGIPVAAMVYYIGSGSGDVNATYNGSQP
jgi:hypothetical protein